MTFLTITASVLVAMQAQAAASLDGIKKAERFAAAIEGKADFQDADFTKALSAQEKSALRKIGKCKVQQVGYATQPHPLLKNTVEQDFNRLGLNLDCAGVSTTSPVAISLHLQDGRIARVETHTADVMRRD
jgi:hypothetical protein